MIQPRSLISYLFLSMWLFLLLSSCGKTLPSEFADVVDQLPEKVSYNFHIRPILSDRCFKCHGPDANARKGELRLDLEEEAFKNTIHKNALAGKVLQKGSYQQSDLYHRINSDDTDYQMPPSSSNLSLTTYEKALITKWIQQGANYEQHWAFTKISNPPVPIIENEWITNDIDRFIIHKIEEAKIDLSPSPMADNNTLIRRASLDLTGLTPSTKLIAQFTQPKSTESTLDQLIDTLQASSQYGERMAMEWLDVSRYADTHGYQDDGLRNTFPYRDWLIRAYNQNIGFDDFITWQIAGDLLENPTDDQLVATCFNRNHPQSQEGGIVDEEYRVEYVADRTNTFSKAFLGLTVECARCHDHKYDPISQKDYYSLYAFFNNNNESGIVPYNGEASPTLFLPSDKSKRKLDSLKIEIDSLEKLLDYENYLTDFKKWYDSIEEDINTETEYGLLADFSFEKELTSTSEYMNLDHLEKSKLSKKKKEVFAYYNSAKSRPDASPSGDVDRRPTIGEGKNGNGLNFIGDCGLRFNRDLDLDKSSGIAVSLWVKPLQSNISGPIFNNTNGDFEGYRGWLCKLNEDGTLSFQLNHVWPDNAIDIQTIDTVPVDRWTHIAFSYDGSSRAGGVKIYINGETPENRIHADKLYKSLLHGKQKSNWSNLAFMLGVELRQSIKDIQMDELKVYDRAISLFEVQSLYKGQWNSSKSKIPESQLVEHYLLTGQNASYNTIVKEIKATRQLENLIATDEPEVMVMHERAYPRKTYLLERGMYDELGEEVNPSIPTIFANTQETSTDRLALANWLTSPDNPLTARVAVNRLWKMLFGRGLVATQEDFGSQGILPTHPELLDWLANKYIESGWDTKAMLKFIMQSSAYRQSSVPSSIAVEVDPENRFYSHFPAYRLSAEMIRDNALAASQLLVKQIGGPSVYPYQPPGVWEALATRNAVSYNQQHGDNLYRRSMYTIWKRSSPPPSMMTFDAPDRYICTVDRQKTATPLQSLVMLNDDQFLEASRVLGQHMMDPDIDDPIEFAFTSLIGRSPTAAESDILSEERKTLYRVFKNDTKTAQSWISAGEYPIPNDLDKIELATNTVIASTIMNFDEFVMKR